MTCPNCKKPDDVVGGYKNGTDLTWCKHCGLIRWASDGLIPAAMYGRDDHAEYCQRVLGLVAFGCAIEADNNPQSLNRGVGRCKTWCGHHGCATAPNLAYVEPGSIEYDSWVIAPPLQPSLTATAILQAVARGWCHEKTRGLVMDPDLAIAIAAEVSAAIATRQGEKP